MPRPRFSLRTLLIAVTVFALIIAQVSRVVRLNRLADQHHHEKLISGFSILKYTRRHHQKIIDRLQLATEYHETMEDKYRAQIWRPWIALEPDPPMPPSVTPWIIQSTRPATK